VYIKIDNADMSNTKKILKSFIEYWSFIFSFFFGEMLYGLLVLGENFKAMS